MSAGSRGFNGDRLREARETRGLTAVALSELAGVTPQAISRYEHGDASPSREVTEAFARSLNVPLAFFTYAARSAKPTTVFYRSMAAATKRARTRAQWKLTWLSDLVDYLGQSVAFPESNLPDLRLPADPLAISNDDIESAAEDARRFWSMGVDAPIGNMVALLENNGVIVARQSLGAEELDSLSTFDPGEPRAFVILGVDKGTAVRWRYDAAHELGHLVLHSAVSDRDLVRATIFNKIEEQAHRFAGAFLMPYAAFSEDVFALSLDVLRELKPKWKTSVASMIRRSRHTGLITEETEKRMWINLSRRGWRREEPYDETWQPEEPRVLARAIELVLTEGRRTVDDLVVGTGLSSADIESLAGLSSGFLTGGFTPVRLIPRSSNQTIRNDRPPADVVPLPFKRREK
ncbi:MAG: ImmA/IrrE family metallo-endopeptidase [Armatimonadetes bacterium]|nr:ImmA/IrrE family metallo-endopeptidase [Armatimonadota bacterium]